MKRRIFIIGWMVLLLLGNLSHVVACSIIYYIDQQTGHIYIANNEDYFYDVKAYIQISRATEGKYARLWYGWDNFAQGGINEAGLFFDGAVTPEQKIPMGFHKPKGNLGDEILARCSTAEQAVTYLETHKIALSNAHMIFGDSTGNAIVVEWVKGQRKLKHIENNKLVMTNFLLSDTTAGNYPCYRYSAINEQLAVLDTGRVDLRAVGNALARAAQTPRPVKNGKTGGTLYSTFVDVSKMEFILVYQLDNAKITKLNLRKVFAEGKNRKIKLK